MRRIRLKTIVGVLLMVLALAALFFWESCGREMLTTEEYLISSKDIFKGDVITEDMFCVCRSDTAISGALRPDAVDSLSGQIAANYIPKNSQICQDYFSQKEEEISGSIYRIKSEWIDNRSSSLRKGDIVCIYSKDGEVCFGRFMLAFVKTSDDKEVTEEEGLDQAELGKRRSDVMRRSGSEGYIDHIEIVCNLDDYLNIAEFAENHFNEFGDIEPSLLIVQEVNSND